MKKRSIQDLIESFLENNKNRIVISQKKGYRTFGFNGGVINEKIKKTRIFFKKQNIKKGDKIIILGNDSLEWIVVYFACILSGVIVIPLDVMSDKKLLRKIQKQVNAKIIFLDRSLDKGLFNINYIDKIDSRRYESLASKVEQSKSKFNPVSVNNKIKKFYLDDLDDVLKNIRVLGIDKVKINPKDILEIIYTSGTTSEPKGVVLTHENLTVGVNSAVELIPLRIRLKVLNLLPLSHIFSQVYGLFFLMHFNHEIFFIDSIQPKKIIVFIKNKKINGVVLVPGILENLKRELEGKSVLLNLGAQFRLIGVGGAFLDVELEKWWKKKFIAVIQGYGLTETSSVVSGNKIISKTGSVGRVAEGVDVKLAKDKEILVKGKNVSPGYFKGKSKQVFEDGWFKTGDIGIIKNGYLYIKERKKDIIITSSGLNVYPTDIEKVLNKISGVKESCVLEKDKKIHAILILDKKVNVSDIIKKANEKLLSHQKITSSSVWNEDFPKTPLGKIKKYVVLQEMQEIEKLKTKRPQLYRYEDKLFNIVNKILKSSQKINLKSKLSELGVDSLKRVELISELEKEFDVEIDETKINQNTRVADLKKIMKEKPLEKIKFKKWPMNFISSFIRKILQTFLVFPLTRIFTKTEYEGVENLKIKQPVVCACNHQSVLDSPVVIKILNKKFKTAIAAESDYVFGIGTKGQEVKGFFLRFYRKLRGYSAALISNAYPFGESIGIDTSLEFTGEMLDNGYSVLIFPEAHRTSDGKIKNFKSGIGYLTLNMKVPVVPVRIEGLFEIMPAGKIIPNFGRSKVKIGKPILFEEFKDLSYIEVTKLIEKKVKGL